MTTTKHYCEICEQDTLWDQRKRVCSLCGLDYRQALEPQLARAAKRTGDQVWRGVRGCDCSLSRCAQHPDRACSREATTSYQVRSDYGRGPIIDEVPVCAACAQECEGDQDEVASNMADRDALEEAYAVDELDDGAVLSDDVPTVEQGAHLRLIFREPVSARHPTGLRQVEALITWTEQRPEGTYFGYQPFDRVNECAWGCAMLRSEPAPFGLQSVEVM